MTGPLQPASAPSVRTLKTFLTLFGAVCCSIAVAHFVVGSRAIFGSVPVNPTMDGEDRFFAALFFGFGAVTMWTAKQPVERRSSVRLLLAVFFLGGAARGVSALQVGMPNTLYMALGAIELLLPPAVALWLDAAIRADTVAAHAVMARR